MTQPSLNSTFDTSLVDVSSSLHPNLSPQPTFTGSFSSTNTDPSDNGQPSTLQPNPAASCNAPSKPVRYTTTAAAYEEWAETYDTDGNVLQGVDDLELETLLPGFLALIATRPDAEAASKAAGQKLRVVDLGCGTGRNTLKLLSYSWRQATTIVGLDASVAMLDVARRKCASHAWGSNVVEVVLLEHDAMLKPSPPPQALNADAVISTLVLEHLPLSTFFAALQPLIRPGGHVLLTNMHPNMGSSSQAGFVSKNGEKVRGVSWAHGVEETVEAARAAGFELVDKVREARMSREVAGLLGERANKWVGSEVWYGMTMRRT
ncbi:hypothetical protein B0A49_13849 [Cryomyces minteri]|uniref:Methyltransferase domain-containing protein n=1 Tax=Cryomyces minteri TaxID=331657 RepID=A0A4U0VSQ6_9PEZI|nr:hypothetical protein B0A49_13849 [Cryomyces minteri]